MPAERGRHNGSEPEGANVDEYRADEADGADDGGRSDQADAVTPGADEFSTDEFSTGDAEVDAAIAHLGDLDDAPVREHAAVFDEVHRRLGAVLTGSSAGHPSDR
jgi:hypothetical protein